MNETLRVLVVGADARVTNRTARLLHRAGHAVERAGSGDEGWRVAQDRRPALVLIERDLQDGDGLELCRRIKADPTLADSMVVMTSASHPRDDDHAEGLGSVADDCIGRPIANRELLARIAAFGRIVELRQTLRRQATDLRAAGEVARRAQAATLNLLEDAVEARTRAEAAMAAAQESEARLRAFYDLGLVGLAITTPAKTWLSVNHRLHELLEYRPAELAAITWAQLSHPDDLSADLAQFQRVLDGDIDGYEMEKRFITRSGRVITTELVVRCVRKPDRSVDYFISMILDITRRKADEVTLRQNEARLRLAHEVARLGDWDWNLGTNQLFWAAANYEIHGIDPSVTPSYEAFLAVVDPAEHAAVTEAVAAVLAGTAPFDIDYTAIRPDTGERVVIHSRAEVLRDATGTPVRMVGTVQDVTTRKRNEAEINRLARALDVAPSAITVHDFSGRFLMANETALQLHGYTRDEFMALTLDQLDVPTSAEQIAARMQVVREQGRAIFDVEHLRNDGTILPLTVSISLTTWNDQPVILSVATDITERKRAEAERASLEAQLAQAQKMESVGRLAGGVAHDFNNMLAVILGNVEFALADAELGSPLATDLLEIEQAARHSAELTRQLLAFARVGPVSPEVLDLNGALTGSVAMLGRLIGEDIHLSFRPGPGLWPVRIDRSQLEAILTNLVVNARDAIAGVGTISLATANLTLDAAGAAAIPDAAPGDYVTLTVSDTGAGMTSEVLAHVFEPFYTTKPVGQGTGLGLSTVYGSLRQAGGCITVESTPGAGTTFRLYLPRHGEPAVAGPGPADPAARGGRETILLVEDEPALLRLAARGLQAQGYTVIAAHGPAEARRLAAGQPGGIDLVLTDVVMPELSGPDLVAALRSGQPGLRPIYMSGYPAGHLVDDGSRFLAKPFALADLLAAVRATLDEA